MEIIETIKVASNQSKRTFTIRMYSGNKLLAKYRTIKMSQKDFDVEEMNTQNDWKYYLRSSQDYYEVNN